MLGVGLFLDRLSPNLPSRQWRMRVSRGCERENDEGGKRNAFTSANRGRAEGDPPPQTLSCAIGARSSGLPARGDFPLRPRPGPRQRVDRARRTRGLHLPLCRLFAAVAEGEGFEPPVPVIPGQRFSRPSQSVGLKDAESLTLSRGDELQLTQPDAARPPLGGRDGLPTRSRRRRRRPRSRERLLPGRKW
jgi:hypothetical protein